jgi:cytochrome c oxidase subunit 2
MQRKIAYFLTLTALVLALSACGGNANKDSASSAPAAETASEQLVVKATSWEFDKTEYAIPKDTPVQVSVENLKGAHSFEIVGQDIDIKGGTSEIVNLPAGTYDIKCNIMCGTGHTQMKAKLVVS